MGVEDIIEGLKYLTDVLDASTETILHLTAENKRLETELIEFKAVVERWLKLGMDQNEQQTVFWDDDIVNLLKYIRGEKIE